MLARDSDDRGVDLTHLLASLRVLCRKTLGAARTRRRLHAGHDARGRHATPPASSAGNRTQMARIGEVDVGGVHTALAQQPPRRTPRVPQRDRITSAGELVGPHALPGHSHSVARLAPATALPPAESVQLSER